MFLRREVPMDVKTAGADTRFDRFLEAIERADMTSGDRRVTAHSSAVVAADWARIQSAKEE
jgi:hypothetical protein